MRASLFLLFTLGLAPLSPAALLTNGDFESGTAGFTVSGYTYDATVGSEATYAVLGSVPNGWSPGFTDHTSGSGNMLIVNAATALGQNFWVQDVAVVAGVDYTFSGWVASLTFAPTPTIRLDVDGSAIGSFSAADIDDTWQFFSFIWTAAATETVTLSLTDTVAAAGGDDFAIDDLTLVPEPQALMPLLFSLLLVLRRRR